MTRAMRCAGRCDGGPADRGLATARSMRRSVSRGRAHRCRQDVERRFLSLPSADSIRDAHRVLTDQPHMAGTARDRELAEWTRDRFQNFGLEEVAITTHDVLLPWPLEVNVEMTAPRRWRASMREEPVAGRCAHASGASRPEHSRITPTPRQATSRHPSSMPATGPRGLRLAVGAGASTCAARSRSCATRSPTATAASRRSPRSSEAPLASSSTRIRPTTAQRRGRCIPKDRGARTLTFSGAESPTTSWFRATR